MMVLVAMSLALIVALRIAYRRGFRAGVDAVNAAARDEHAEGFSAVEETS